MNATCIFFMTHSFLHVAYVYYVNYVSKKYNTRQKNTCKNKKICVKNKKWQ